MAQPESPRPIVISCDGHAAGRPPDYRPYIEAAYREPYEEFVAHWEAVQAERAKAREEDRFLFSKQGSEAFEAETGDGRDGEWNSKLRTRVLEQDGVVAEVLFPNAGVPFSAFGESGEHELRGVGVRAYNRWVLDFADDEPGRRAPLAVLAVHDVPAAVAEVAWAAAAGMKGVILPSVPGPGLPPWVDPCYDPIWAACEAAGLPVHVHSGGGLPDYGDYGVVSMMLFATETTFFASRVLWFFLWGGVFERFPKLQFVLTETRAEWVPGTLKLLEGIYHARFFSHIRDTLPLTPSEYWARQCHVTASFMTADEAAIRHEIGLPNLMWGADYPHIEGTWPRTRKSLARCFRGVPVDDARTILSRNPAALYGFDLDALQPVADRVCPATDELVGTAA